MMNDNKISLFQSISFKIPLIILLVLLIGIGFTIAYYLQSQNATIIQTKENEIHQEAGILYTAIKSNMLAGEAPITVNLFNDFTRGDFASEIKLYKKNGAIAFADNNTIAEVNKNIKKNKFLPKKVFPIYEKIDDKNFLESINNVDNVFVKDIDKNKKRIIIYRPLLNQPKCSTCHGIDHVIRGVIKISTPVDKVYHMAQMNIILSVIIYCIVVIILTAIIIIFLRRVIILRILQIGSVVERVGQGDLKIKVNIPYSDEIGALADRINTMIGGLNERFKLTKFVSKSTLDHVIKDDEIKLGGEKKILTVLFSDIRGFTSFSENRDPHIVLTTLNNIMNIQARIVQEFNGDVDKFVGDELMAVFEGEDMVLRAIKAADKIRNEIEIMNKSNNVPIYVGIGINTGEMISGNMGSLDRIDRTVIGDAVNLGARLCSIAGKNVIVLSEFSYAYVKKYIDIDIDIQEHEPIKVKGKEKEVKIYTLRKIL